DSVASLRAGAFFFSSRRRHTRLSRDWSSDVCSSDLGRLDAGVDIFNVSGAANTPDIVKKIRDIDPDVAILATGGKNEEDISRTIDAGANAISHTPPTTGELFKDIMLRFRSQ